MPGFVCTVSLSRYISRIIHWQPFSNFSNPFAINNLPHFFFFWCLIVDSFKLHLSLFLSTSAQAKKTQILPLLTLVENSNYASSCTHVASLSLTLTPNHNKHTKSVYLAFPSNIRLAWEACLLPHYVSNKPFCILLVCLCVSLLIFKLNLWCVWVHFASSGSLNTFKVKTGFRP